MHLDRSLTSCPSALPEQPGAQIIGVVRGESGATFMQPLPRALPVGAFVDLIPATVRPTEVLRFSAPCAERRCAHFEQGKCHLATRVVSELSAVTERLTPCAVRPTCRWFGQEGPAACRRCPQVITEPYAASELMREVARPAAKGAMHVRTV
jgi:hypothetical protein